MLEEDDADYWRNRIAEALDELEKLPLTLEETKGLAYALETAVCAAVTTRPVPSYPPHLRLV